MTSKQEQVIVAQLQVFAECDAVMEMVCFNSFVFVAWDDLVVVIEWFPH